MNRQRRVRKAECPLTRVKVLTLAQGSKLSAKDEKFLWRIAAKWQRKIAKKVDQELMGISIVIEEGELPERRVVEMRSLVRSEDAAPVPRDSLHGAENQNLNDLRLIVDSRKFSPSEIERGIVKELLRLAFPQLPTEFLETEAEKFLSESHDILTAG